MSIFLILALALALALVWVRCSFAHSFAACSVDSVVPWIVRIQHVDAFHFFVIDGDGPARLYEVVELHNTSGGVTSDTIIPFLFFIFWLIIRFTPK